MISSFQDGLLLGLTADVPCITNPSTVVSTLSSQGSLSEFASGRLSTHVAISAESTGSKIVSEFWERREDTDRTKCKNVCYGS